MLSGRRSLAGGKSEIKEKWAANGQANVAGYFGSQRMF